MRRSLRSSSSLLTLGLGLGLAIGGCGDDSLGSESDAATASGTATASSDTATATASASASATASASASATATSSASASATATDSATTGDTATTGAGTDSATTTGTSDTASTSSTATSGTGTTTTGGLDEPIAAAAPSWLRRVDGISSLAPPRVAPLPDGDVAALITGGLYAHEIVLAEGDADEQVLGAMYTAPALARFDGATGALLEGRMLAKLGQGTQYGMSVLPRELKLASDGDLLVVGTWTGTTEFFPGTADSATHITQMKTVGDQFHRAEDPFVFRMTPDGAVSWFVRGQTPPPLSTTWFNYGKGIAPLPDGGLILAGDYELSGFVAASNTAGAKTMSGGQKSYFARLGADGEPTWVYRNSRQLPFYPLRSGVDGAIYGLLPKDATLFEDAGAPWMTGSEPDLGTSVLGRLDPDGGVLWSARFAKEPPVGPVRGLEPTADGDLLVYGNGGGDLLFRDATDATMTLPLGDGEGWIAGLSADGEALWLRSLGPTIFALGPTLIGDDGVWLLARIKAPYELEVAGETVALPDLGFEDPSTVSALLRIDAEGDVVAVQLLGVDLAVDGLAWSGPEQDAFLTTGGYWCGSSQPFVIADGGDALEGLKYACDMEPNDDQRGYVAAIPRVN